MNRSHHRSALGSLLRTMAYSSISEAGSEPSAGHPRSPEGPLFGPIGRQFRVFCTLAGAGVFATVLASQPVYAKPPPRGQSSNHSSTESEPARTPATPPEPSSQKTKASSGDRVSNTSRTRTTTTARTSTVRTSPRPTPTRRRTATKTGPESERDPVRVAMRTTTTAPAETAPSSGASRTNSGTAPAGRSSRSDRDRADSPATRTVIEDEFLVEGKLEKPSAYYILRRSSLDYDWARLDAKFSPLVLESVQDPLF